ncbi:type I methionyl aminopeptidase [Elusimicrobiota bacterium]
MIDYKSKSEISIMYDGGRYLSEIANELKDMIEPGITTMYLDKKTRAIFEEKKVTPAFLNYGSPPFPATICTSINDEIVHGIPSSDRILQNGDIISLDLGGIWKGFYTDMAFTVGVGMIGKNEEKLLGTTENALETGITKMYTSNKLYDISWAIQQVAESAGYSVVRDLVGHGIGRKLHESPNVPNYGEKSTGIKLEEGLTLALEPMLNAGTYKIRQKDDGWTIVTEDGRLSSHYENTIAITKSGPKLLTSLDMNRFSE